MDRLDAIRLFVRVVESGSFSSVAREAGVGQPAVSKQIAALETHLGAQLLRRTSRSMTLTDAGQTFYEAALRLVGELDTAESLVGRGQSLPSGLVRVTAPPGFARLCIVPLLPAFFARYPEVSVDLSATERRVNLIEEGVDVAIRSGHLVDSSLVSRKLGVTAPVTVATHSYLAAHGAPKKPRDLESHACIVRTRDRKPWKFRDEGESIVHYPRGSFHTSDPEQIRAAVLADLGIGHAPKWLFASDIASGAVRVILRKYETAPYPLSAVHTAGRRLPTKVRSFVDFLATAFAQRTGW